MSDTTQISGSDGEVLLLHHDRVLGSGTFGRVFAAETIDGIALAVKKVQLTGLAGTWYNDARRARREIEVGRRISYGSSHLMPIRDHFTDDDFLYLVMPRALQSLAKTIADQGQLSEADTIEVVRQCASALTELATLGIVHRDIKPENVLWLENRWVLADFGIARILDQDTAPGTWFGAGSRDYWAPELFDGTPTTVLTDLYALGCTAYHALTGHPPFDWSADPGGAHRHEFAQLPDIADPNFNRVVHMLLAKDPTLRPPDARKVTELLTPTAGLTGAQRALQLLAAAASDNAVNRDRAHHEAQQLDEARGLAKRQLTAVWDELSLLARDAIHEGDALHQLDSWFLTAADGRLAITLATMPGSTGVILGGEVTVRHLDAPPDTVVHVANVVCRRSRASLDWRMLTFVRNDMSREKTQLTVVDEDPAGTPLPYLPSLLTANQASSHPHTPPGIVTDVPLTANLLLEQFVRGLGVIAHR